VHLVHVRDIATQFHHVFAMNGVHEDRYEIAGVWKGPDESVVEGLDLDDVRIEHQRRVRDNRTRHR